MNWEGIDDALDEARLMSKATAMLPPEGTPPRLSNGLHTLSFPDGSSKTFRVRTRPASDTLFAGKRVIGVLIGPEGTDEFEDFGFVSEQAIAVWKNKRPGGKMIRWADLIWRLSGGDEEIDGFALETIKRTCLVCNRPLTAGAVGEVGPSCLKKKK